MSDISRIETTIKAVVRAILEPEEGITAESLESIVDDCGNAVRRHLGGRTPPSNEIQCDGCLGIFPNDSNVMIETLGVGFLCPDCYSNLVDRSEAKP